MAGWGESLWGVSGWGAGEAAAPPESDVVSADVYASNLIALTFSLPMKNNLTLKNKDLYAIVPEGTGSPVLVHEVRTGNTLTTRTVFLVVSGFTVGETYTVTVSAGPVASSGAPLSVLDNIVQFIGRRTKIDSMVDSRPGFYDVRPSSNMFSILAAIGRQDDLIGGSRDDDL